MTISVKLRGSMAPLRKRSRVTMLQNKRQTRYGSQTTRSDECLHVAVLDAAGCLTGRRTSRSAAQGNACLLTAPVFLPTSNYPSRLLLLVAPVMSSRRILQVPD